MKINTKQWWGGAKLIGALYVTKNMTLEVGGGGGGVGGVIGILYLHPAV